MGQESMKILVVDDEMHICELLEEFLTMIGFRVATVSDGEKAVDRFEAETPDIVFLDIKMPGINGIDILQLMKAGGRSFGAVMLSAFGDDETIREALDAGADYYIQKPMDLERLKQTLDELTQAMQGQEPR